MRIAVIGLSYTHPYTYSAILPRFGARASHVWDADPAAARELAERYGATAVETVEQALEAGPDGAIVTSRGPERTGHALACIERGIPTYVGKPMVTNLGDLARIGEAVRRTGCPVMSTSILRFAPGIQALARWLAAGKAGTLLALRASSIHSIERYMEEPHRWQDHEEQGGGTIVTMGVHAVDPLILLLGREIESISCERAKRRYTESMSEDVALMTLRWPGGLLASVELVGGFAGEFYGVGVYGSEASYRVQVPKGDVVTHEGAAVGDADPWVELGYVATMEAFLELCRTRVPPFPLEETEVSMRTLLAARRSAIERRPIELASFG